MVKNRHGWLTDLSKDTLIVVASDNGRPFPRDKTYLYDSGIKTPWVVHYSRLIKELAVTTTRARFVSDAVQP